MTKGEEKNLPSINFFPPKYSINGIKTRIKDISHREKLILPWEDAPLPLYKGHWRENGYGSVKQSER